MEDLLLKGICDGYRAFRGPEIVQFDVTNRCNNNCLCCWNNSPLLGEPSHEWKQERECELPFDLVRRTIAELKELGTKKLFFAGGGEPFMHPQFLDILRFAKECGMQVFMNSNFTLVDEKMAEELVRIKVDLIHVSMLAGSPQSYVLMHPNKTETAFFRIKEVLQHLAVEKERTCQSAYPHIDLYYVICNTNYLDIKIMVDLAMEVKANSLEFTPVDVIPGKTDALLLTEEQRAQVLREVRAQHDRLDAMNKEHNALITFIEQYDAFVKRLSSTDATGGHYESSIVTAMPCYVGWAFSRIMATGDVVPCLKAHKLKVGNIYRQSFTDIWNGIEQQLFRHKTFALDGTDPYLKFIGNDPDQAFGCLTACDNIQINKELHDCYGKKLEEYGKIKTTH